MSQHDSLPPGDAERELLARRAARFSSAAGETDHQQDAEEVVAFSLNGTTWAAPLRMLSEIRRLGRYTPLPQAASHILGVVNVRNRIVGIYRLGSESNVDAPEAGQPGHMNVAEQEATTDEERFLLIGQGPAAHVALLADQILGTDLLGLDEDLSTPVTLEASFIRGVDPLGRVHLDLERMVEDMDFYRA